MTVKYDVQTKQFSYLKTDIEGPVFQIYMPLDKSGHGPADEKATRFKTWEVWDQVLNVICKCSSKEDADYIAELINKEKTING